MKYNPKCDFISKDKQFIILLPLQNLGRFCPYSRLTNQFVQKANCPVETGNVLTKNCSVMANPIAKMNLTKMLAVSLNEAINKYHVY